MSDTPDAVNKSADALKVQLEELLAAAEWRHAASANGSNKLRSMAKRIVLAAQSVEAHVKENTFSK